MTRKKVVNDDLFKRKFVVVNFWCFLQSWCIRLEKNLFKLSRIFRDACQSQKYCQKSDMLFFVVWILENRKNVVCLLLWTLPFQQLIAKMHFHCIEVQSFLYSIEIDIRKCKKKSFWYLKVEAGRKSSSSAVDCGKWASSSRFKIANS